MLWIGAIFGALFGWIGILVAALFWATLAIFKLVWVLTVFGFQLLLAVGAVLARAIVWLFNQVSDRTATRNAAAHIQTTTASTRKNKGIPAGPNGVRFRDPVDDISDEIAKTYSQP
jgi:hypothetical protein